MKLRVGWAFGPKDETDMWEDTPTLRRLMARGIVSEIRHRPKGGDHTSSESCGILSSDERVALPQ